MLTQTTNRERAFVYPSNRPGLHHHTTADVTITLFNFCLSILVRIYILVIKATWNALETRTAWPAPVATGRSISSPKMRPERQNCAFKSQPNFSEWRVGNNVNLKKKINQFPSTDAAFLAFDIANRIFHYFFFFALWVLSIRFSYRRIISSKVSSLVYPINIDTMAYRHETTDGWDSMQLLLLLPVIIMLTAATSSSGAGIN